MDRENKKVNKYEFYQKSVQNVKKETEFFRKTYRMIFNKVPNTFREDFCGTGLLSCEWVKNNVMSSAVGIDIDQEALDYGEANNINCDRVKLINQNVLDEFNPDDKFDVICSLNYSHFLLNKRSELLTYFKNVRKNITKGIFIIDFFGGSHIYSDHKYEHSKSSGFYEFEGGQMNILNNKSLCKLNHKIKKNKFETLFKFAFRIYSLIELREALEEANFNNFKLFIKEINDDDGDDYAEYEEVDINGEFFTESERYNGFLISYIS